MYNINNQSALSSTGGYSFLDSEISFLANQLKGKANKVLRSHGKSLRMYLQCARLPEAYANSDPALWNNVERSLFNAPEIHEFLEEENCPPLRKLVILAEHMNRTLVVNISGVRSAQIPLHYSDNPNDYISQLWLSIYGLMALMHNGFDNFDESNKNVVPMECTVKETSVNDIAENGGACYRRSPGTWPLYSDCESLESLILAADYYGFRLDFDFRRPR
jgi:hypothetical protein